MTLTELTAAMWDQREITLGTVCGVTVRGIPYGVEKMPGDLGLWRISYRSGGQPATLCRVFSGFDGHIPLC